MGKVTIEISEDAAEHIIDGIGRIIGGLEQVAKGVAILSVYDSDKAFLLKLREFLAQEGVPVSAHTQP